MRFDAGDGVTFRLQGKIDRVDEVPGNALRVVDYKTGSAFAYKRDAKQAPFNGGRQLQPVLYAAAVAQELKRQVAVFEYRIPGERPPHDRVVWAADELTRAGPLVRSLLGELEAGHFLATDSTGDCTFCDFGPICRVQEARFNKTISPRAEWAAAHGERDAAYTQMRVRRAKGAP